MFSALRQGSIIYILERADKLVCRTAQVTSVSSPQFNPNNFNQGQFCGTINISVNDNGNSRDFGGLPPAENLVRYNNGAVVVSESRDAIVSEVQSIVSNSESILDEDNLKRHRNNVDEGKAILAQLSPQFAKEQALDNEVKNLHNRVDSMDAKLDRLLALASNGGNIKH